MNYADTVLMASSEDSAFPVVKSVSDSTVDSLSASFAFYIQEKSSKNVEEVLYLMNTHGRKCHLNNNNFEENKNCNPKILFTSSTLSNKDPSLSESVASSKFSSVSASFSPASSYKKVFNVK